MKQLLKSAALDGWLSSQHRVTHHVKRLTAWLGGVSMSVVMASPALGLSLDASPQLKKITDNLVASGAYSREELTDLFAPIELDQGVLKAMNRQAEAMPWHKYKKIFLNEQRITKGVVFWREHEALINRVADEYGIPPKILVALLGVETYYGERMGSKQVIRSLATLAAAYPRRADFFSKELQKFLEILKEEKLVAADVQGSFAGAIGIPQFMPTSYDAYAVDGNGNGKRDLVYELDDAVASVANYLSVHGWQSGQEIRQWLEGELPESVQAQVSKKAKPKVAVSTLKAAGLPLSNMGSKKAAVIKLKDDTGARYFVGYQNFYAITRYNPSSKYAMAICELADRIEAQK